MKTPDKALSTGKLRNWLEENEKELFKQWENELHPEVRFVLFQKPLYIRIAKFIKWLYNLLGHNQRRVEQPLELKNFIPCNKKGEPMEKPKVETRRNTATGERTETLYPIDEVYKEFEQAEQDVLFARILRTNKSYIEINGRFYKYFHRGIPSGEKVICLEIDDVIVKTIEQLITEIPNISISKTYYQPIFKI